MITSLLNNDLLPSLTNLELFSSFQIPSFHIVGLPGPEVNEARERVKAALISAGFDFPKRRIIVNLSPANIQKRGTGLDLAIALTVIRSTKKGKHLFDQKVLAWGELGLDGGVKKAGQTTRIIYAGWAAGCKEILLSAEDMEQAEKSLTLISECKLFDSATPRLRPIRNLKEIISAPFLEEEKLITIENSLDSPPHPQLLPISSSQVRTLCASLIGLHHLIILGPRGTGKSHLLEWLTALHPKASPKTRITQALISEIAPLLCGKTDVPIRRISSLVRPTALTGSLATGVLRPGEFSLAHGGILIADELLEWARDSREILREPLESGEVTITAAKGSHRLPASFLFAGNGNLCPCGGWPPNLPIPRISHKRNIKPKRCKCGSHKRQAYLNRLSGPLLDRVDMLIITAVPNENSLSKESFDSIKTQINVCRQKQESLWGKPAALLSGSELEDIFKKFQAKKSLLLKNSNSLRDRHKIMRLSLSLATLDNAVEPSEIHLMEASYYRPEHYGL